MHMLFLIILFLFSNLYSASFSDEQFHQLSLLIHCADEESITKLPDGMWGANNRSKDPRNYFKKKSNLPELIKEEVMNPFWLKMEKASQKEKDSTLFKIILPAMQHYPYLEIRKNIAAAVWAGANLQHVQNKVKLFPFLIEKNDISLVSFLIAHNASADETGFFDNPLIFSAKTVAMAKLLIDANKYEQDDLQKLRGNYSKKTLLHKVMIDDYEPELIPFYRSYGISPLMNNKHQNSPLMELVYHNKQNAVIKKAALLLTRLTPAQKVALIWTEGQDCKIIFDIIPKNKQCHALKIFLRKTVKKAVRQIEYPEECTICLEQLNQKSNTLYLTPCCHLFHEECVDPWIQKGSSTCPCCRKDLTYATLIEPSDFYE